MNKRINRRSFLQQSGAGLSALALVPQVSSAVIPKERPNIVWILAEDMSPHMSCYGETTIQTPIIDRMAKEGILFKNAFVTAPVCSPSRSAMITGMHQTTIGAHNHRSSRGQYKINLPEHVKLIPQYMKKAGYYTSLGGIKFDGTWIESGLAKTDYNFEWDPNVYDSYDSSGRKARQPFFAQIMLSGGKNRNVIVPNPVDPADVKIPPYYPDHPVLRADWARYLNSVINTDHEVGTVLHRLKDEGVLDNTIVMFWTDHGISHVRDKQFLYEGGIHVPLIMHWPKGFKAGQVREDLVSHIDISATTLYLAGLGVPVYMEGRPLFGPAAKPRDFVISGRDRCDENIDRIRSVRTQKYKYIRNYFPFLPLSQFSIYKYSKDVTQTMHELYYQGKLTPQQAQYFTPNRPLEELYDLEADPYEMNNLAKSPQHQKALLKLRGILKTWIAETDDKGQYPESLDAYSDECRVLDVGNPRRQTNWEKFIMWNMNQEP